MKFYPTHLTWYLVPATLSWFDKNWVAHTRKEKKSGNTIAHSIGETERDKPKREKERCTFKSKFVSLLYDILQMWYYILLIKYIQKRVTTEFLA
jgi:hypothetical protein